jgi:2-polyprenyl-6-hydroxyphenyl methylase/3-demethylubiquinone-9 3-methyltransferase
VNKRFAFGRNWQQYLTGLNDEKIHAAECALVRLLDMETFTGLRFLDIGSGSGLHSLAARKLGAEVHSFDFDSESVACTQALKSRYFPNDLDWRIEYGSILDQRYVQSLGVFDIVYAWGVLHHTGQIWQALLTAMLPVKTGGILALALYNRHWTSPIWKGIKYLYNASPDWMRPGWLWTIGGLKSLGAVLTTKTNPLSRDRGMQFRHDLIDWLGGYPYEYAAISDVTKFVERQGFQTITVLPTSGWTGCNQFVFRKSL